MLLTIKLGLLNAIVPRAVIAAVWPLPRPTLVPAGLGSSLRNRLRKKQSAPWGRSRQGAACRP